MAQTYVGVAPQQVGSVDASASTRAQVSPVNPTAARAGGLAFTGTDAIELLLIAGASVAVGTVVVRLSRVRTTT